MVSSSAASGARLTDPDLEFALPMYEGRLFGAFDFAAKRWIDRPGEKGRWEPVPWERKVVGARLLIGAVDAFAFGRFWRAPKIAYRNITRSTDRRSMIATVLVRDPTPHVTYNLVTDPPGLAWAGAVLVNSFVVDWLVRHRLGGTHLDEFLVLEIPIVPKPHFALTKIGLRLAGAHERFAPEWLHEIENDKTLRQQPWRSWWALTPHERTRLRCCADALVASEYGLGSYQLSRMLRDCDWPAKDLASRAFTNRLDPRLFWRNDEELDPELRHATLTQVAFKDLEERIQAAGGARDAGIAAFMTQNDGEGWLLPEALRLADHGLGHDERAKHPQPVASRLGPRFYDWQLAQTAEESWRECEIHAKNLQGTGVRSSEARPPADPTIDKRRGPARGKGRRQEEKGLLALDGLEDEPA